MRKQALGRDAAKRQRIVSRLPVKNGGLVDSPPRRADFGQDFHAANAVRRTGELWLITVHPRAAAGLRVEPRVMRATPCPTTD